MPTSTPTSMLAVACVQYAATRSWQKDLATAQSYITSAARGGAKFIVLPELCMGLDTANGHLSPATFPEDSHPVLPSMASLAKALEVHILLGSIGVQAEDGRTFNRSFLISPTGAILARYDKLHLFDIDLGDQGKFEESAKIAPGTHATLASCPGFKIGMTICYDLRFAALFRRYAQAGAQLITCPAAFIRTTGQAHWHTLLRARAIETGSYILAAGQCGDLECGAQVYGHSLIVDPWGRILADAGEAPGFIQAEIDIAAVADVRRKIPAWHVERHYDLIRCE